YRQGVTSAADAVVRGVRQSRSSLLCQAIREGLLTAPMVSDQTTCSRRRIVCVPTWWLRGPGGRERPCPNGLMSRADLARHPRRTYPGRAAHRPITAWLTAKAATRPSTGVHDPVQSRIEPASTGP